MTNWDAVETAATATRRLNNALTGWRASDETLTTAAEVINNIAERIEAGTPRVKLDDMMTRPHLARIYAGQHTPLDLDDGDEIEFDPFSVAGGAFHPSSVGGALPSRKRRLGDRDRHHHPDVCRPARARPRRNSIVDRR